MDRHREVRRGSSSSGMAANNGLTRRRPRNANSLRDSPEEDGAMELQEPSRLRDRGGVSKKDRDRMSRNKRRRGDRLMHHHHHNNHNRGDGDGGGGEDESSDENNNNSLDDDDEDDDEEAGPGPGPGPVRMRPPTTTTTTNNTNTNTSTTNNPSSSSLSNHSNNHNQLHHRKSFPPAKVGRTTTPWKVSDEMGFSVPKKARSVSTKRSHECWIPGGGGSGELAHRQASTSPARPTGVAPPPASSSMAPASPSSSSASIRKKMKPIGQKHRPPKVSSNNNNNNNIGNNNNKPSSVQDDIEIEVAEVLYGLKRQSQCPTRQEAATTNSSQKLDSRDTNGSNNDAKSRVSSPVSASHSSKLPQNSSSSNTPMSAVAPKRKRPRPVRAEEENYNSAGFANKKIEIEQTTKVDVSSAKLEKVSGSAENFTGVGFDFGNSSQPEPVQPDLVKPESSSNTMMMMDSKTLMADESMDQTKKVVVTSPKKESSSCAKVEFDPENATATKATPTASVVESHREESFKFDLMAPPSKSSPERDSDMGFVSESKPVASDAEMKMESEVKGKDNVDIDCKKDTEETVLVEKKREAIVEESDTRKSNAHVKHTMLDLQIDLEKHNKDCGPSIVRQQQQQVPQQHQSKNLRSEPKLEKAAQSTTNSLPLPMNLAGWPAGLPPVGNGMGQVRPQGMTALEGNPASSSFVQLSQPLPKRCATHYYVAKNISWHQQFTKMNPFWPAAAGPASLYGKQPYNLNVLPPTETAMIGNPLLGSFPGRNLNPMQEKSQADGAKDKSSVAANFMDSQPGKLVPKQLVLQQPPQQPALHGPAFIFPLNQQQAAVATTNKAGALKSSNNANATSSVAAQSAAAAPGNSSLTAAAAATTMSFNYPNMPGSEAQYVAILQNNGYPFPVPAHVGAQPTPFRGTPQAMPFFNGSFYSSQMMHTSQLQQQQQQQLQQQMQQAQSQQAPIQQGHQNTSTSSGSSSSQKHQQQHNQQQNHQQRLQSGGGNAASGNSTSFNASKNRTQKPQNQSFPGGPQVRQHEADMGVEDSPSTEDSRVSQAHKNVYNHNFAMPIHPKNFASMSSAALTGGGSGNHSERQQQQQQQQQSIKGGPELISNQAFAMPFASFNGGTAVSGLDFSSMAQNHVIFQSIPEAARHGYHQQMAAAAAAAQAAQHKKNHQISEEGKAVSDSNNAEEERKAGIGKVPPNMGQAIVFSRPDYTDPSVSTILGNSVVESSARTLNLISSPGNGSRPSRSNASATASVPSASAAGNSSNSQQQQQQQQQMNQFMQLQKQQQQQQQIAVMQHQQQMHQQQLAAAAAARAKPSTTNSNSVYTDRHSSSSMAGKFPNAHYFPELPVQGGSSSQSPQWKNTRTTASPVSSPSLASNTSSLKNLPQQQGRAQQGHTQISFGVNSKPGSAQHVQPMPTGNQSPSSPVVVGSPPTSVSKSAGGSPRASSTGSKVGTTSSLSSQQAAKNTSSGPSRKSSPVGGRNVPSNLGNSHANPAQCTTTKSQSHHHQSQQQHQQQQQQHQQQQQQQQQQQKQALQQQAQLFFSNAYMQAHSPQSTSNNSNTSGTPNIGYFQQRRQPAEQQQQQQPGSSNTVSSGMLTLSPSLTLAGATTDPTKTVQAAAAAAAAAANMKGGLPPPGLLQAAQYATQAGGHQFMSTAFPYIHSVPPVQVKPSEQKQPAGNDNLRASWQPEKR